MSAITANTLFHFTKKEDVLFKILDNGFRPSYCTEFGEAIEDVIAEVKIPMVCFCDLPISKLEKHTGVYGRYGLGMSKEWGMKKKLNAVTYVHPNSFLLHSVGQMLQSLTDRFNEETRAYGEFLDQVKGQGKTYTLDPTDPNFQRDLERLNEPDKRLNDATFALSNGYVAFAHMKPYNDKVNCRLFYDEREWRYVIPYTSQNEGDVPYLVKERDGKRDIPLFINQKQRNLEEYKEIIAQKYMLTFEPEDIKYIIVDTDADIHGLISHLKKNIDIKYTAEQVEILTTKILTNYQIEQDF